MRRLTQAKTKWVQEDYSPPNALSRKLKTCQKGLHTSGDIEVVMMDSSKTLYCVLWDSLSTKLAAYGFEETTLA